VFAGRTGGANQNVHIDNLKIATVPADAAGASSPYTFTPPQAAVFGRIRR
jgi:hypothetical protein